MVSSFWVLLFDLLGRSRAVFSLELILPHCWGKMLLSNLLNALWIMQFSSFPVWLVGSRHYPGPVWQASTAISNRFRWFFPWPCYFLPMHVLLGILLNTWRRPSEDLHGLCLCSCTHACALSLSLSLSLQYSVLPPWSPRTLSSIPSAQGVCQVLAVIPLLDLESLPRQWVGAILWLTLFPISQGSPSFVAWNLVHEKYCFIYFV